MTLDKRFVTARLKRLEAVLRLTVHRLFPNRRQRLVRRSSGPEAVRTVQKVLLVDRFQQHDDRSLEYLVLKGWDSNRTRLT